MADSASIDRKRNPIIFISSRKPQVQQQLQPQALPVTMTKAILTTAKGKTATAAAAATTATAPPLVLQVQGISQERKHRSPLDDEDEDLSYSSDEEFQEMIEAFEHAVGSEDEESDDEDEDSCDDDVDHVLRIDDSLLSSAVQSPSHASHTSSSSSSTTTNSSSHGLQEHDYVRMEEDAASQCSTIGTSDDLGSQGTGVHLNNKNVSNDSKSASMATALDQLLMRPKRSYVRHKGDEEKRRRRQEEVNRAVQQCRLKRKAMLTDMRTELECLRGTYRRLQMRSKTLDSDMIWPSFTAKSYPPELESRRHAPRGARYKAESEEERRERVRQQNNQAQYRKALRNKFDEDNMRDEVSFLKDLNSTMKKFIHHRLRNKRLSDDQYS